MKAYLLSKIRPYLTNITSIAFDKEAIEVNIDGILITIEFKQNNTTLKNEISSIRTQSMVSSGHRFARQIVAYVVGYVMYLHYKYNGIKFDTYDLCLKHGNFTMQNRKGTKCVYDSYLLSNVFDTTSDNEFVIREDKVNFFQAVFNKGISYPVNIQNKKIDPEEDNMTKTKYKKEHEQVNKGLFIGTTVSPGEGLMTPLIAHDGVELLQMMITDVIAIKAIGSDDLITNRLRLMNIHAACLEFIKQLNIADDILGNEMRDVTACSTSSDGSETNDTCSSDHAAFYKEQIQFLTEESAEKSRHVALANFNIAALESENHRLREQLSGYNKPGDNRIELTELFNEFNALQMALVQRTFPGSDQELKSRIEYVKLRISELQLKPRYSPYLQHAAPGGGHGYQSQWNREQMYPSINHTVRSLDMSYNAGMGDWCHMGGGVYDLLFGDGVIEEIEIKRDGVYLTVSFDSSSLQLINKQIDTAKLALSERTPGSIAFSKREQALATLEAAKIRASEQSNEKELYKYKNNILVSTNVMYENTLYPRSLKDDIVAFKAALCRASAIASIPTGYRY